MSKYDPRLLVLLACVCSVALFSGIAVAQESPRDRTSFGTIQTYYAINEITPHISSDIRIFGESFESNRGDLVSITITRPDGIQKKNHPSASGDGTYTLSYRINPNEKINIDHLIGTWKATAKAKSKSIGTITFEVIKKSDALRYEPSIDLRIDSESYSLNSLIVISGQIHYYRPGSSNLKLQIFSPNESLRINKYVTPEQDGTFSAQTQISAATWIPGEYMMRVAFMDAVEERTFTVGSGTKNRDSAEYDTETGSFPIQSADKQNLDSYREQYDNTTNDVWLVIIDLAFIIGVIWTIIETVINNKFLLLGTVILIIIIIVVKVRKKRANQKKSRERIPDSYYTNTSSTPESHDTKTPSNPEPILVIDTNCLIKYNKSESNGMKWLADKLESKNKESLLYISNTVLKEFNVPHKKDFQDLSKFRNYYQLNKYLSSTSRSFKLVTSCELRSDKYKIPPELGRDKDPSKCHNDNPHEYHQVSEMYKSIKFSEEQSDIDSRKERNEIKKKWFVLDEIYDKLSNMNKDEWYEFHEDLVSEYLVKNKEEVDKILDLEGDYGVSRSDKCILVEAMILRKYNPTRTIQLLSFDSDFFSFTCRIQEKLGIRVLNGYKYGENI